MYNNEGRLSSVTMEKVLWGALSSSVPLIRIASLLTVVCFHYYV